MRRLLLLLAAVPAGLVSARLVHSWIQGMADAYWRLHSVSADQVVAEDLGTGTLAVGGCDLFMYDGAAAVASFLSFLLLYAAYVIVGFALVSRAREERRKGLLAGWSLLFLLIVLPPVPALRIMELVLVLALLLAAPLPARARSAGVVGVTVVFFGWAGPGILDATAGELFTAGVPGLGEDWLSFPRLFVALSLLVKIFRRVLWLSYELWVGKVEGGALVDVLLYFIGLPFLVGNGVTPPFGHFVQSYGRGSALEGAATMAWCLSVVPLVFTGLTLAAYYPSVRLFFPHCDAPHAGPGTLWARFALTYVVEYLFLLATEQASVGVARLFGFGLKDNYAGPLAAPTVAEFWRRWNIYWREYLVAVFFYPTVLSMARRSGGRRPWQPAVAAGVTFLWTYTLNLLPLALLGGAGQELVVWSPLLVSLAAYYGLEGLAVAVTLYLQARGPRKAPKPAWRRRLEGAAGVAATFVFLAAARSFLNPQFSPQEQLMLLLRALGLEGLVM